MLKNKKNNSKQSEMTDNSEDFKDNISEDDDSENEKIADSVNAEDNKEKNEVKDKEESEEKEESELEKKIKEIEVLTDTMRRRQADFENYKKRMSKIQVEQKKLAIKDFALDVININDDLLRAKEAACNIIPDQTNEQICDAFSEGFAMISNRIEETLTSYGIEEIDSLNQEFDPKYNEAVEISENEDVETDTITLVHQKGFRLDEYVVRTAKVKVTKPVKVVDGARDTDCNSEDSEKPEEKESENIS